ncbi:hypothetical protein [Actinacidiphila rubida]|uniref:Uncharacterized protein n=1 Tax=Actinacidiphila rubida TaxID=310780 RepID=A0A1H8KJZ8_9ACTN|nr:hypothetical protein [Actinacidiphila rubida]SEN92718.1 hypothetical protein SAMN05216267_101325 [Actinacidiphila rubida]
MSFDLGVWSEEVRPSCAAARETYLRLCAADATAVRPSAHVAAFRTALETAASEPVPVAPPEGDAAGAGPASPGDRPQVSGDAGHVLVSMPWPGAADLAPRVVALAARHGLVCFDPQKDVVHVPPALRAPHALELRSCGGPTVADPDPETVERAIRGLSAGSWFVILEDVPGRYLQVGVGADAGRSEGGYAAEFRDGSPESHVRCVLRDRAQVVSLFARFRQDPAVRPDGVAWRPLWG